VILNNSRFTRLGLATQSASGGGTVSTQFGDVITNVNVPRGMVVSSGDLMLVIGVGSQWFVSSLVYSASAVVPENPTSPPPTAPATGTLVVSPVETRSWRTTYGWRTDNTDVYQGEYGGWGNHTGCVFYGDKPQSLAGATVNSATVRVQRLSAGIYAAQPTTMRLMTEKTRPSGTVTLTSSTSGPSLAVGATNDAFTVPASWVQSMVNGTAGGLAFYDADGSPYVRFAGRGSWSPAFTLTINWTRS
jgi:hypothetical protein